ncbi:hypothetical protein BKG91_11055 [Rodentibacter caecimuris]|uniref:hypothetical protein n=1 Tax=Rodentibacter caecimuris TaxID=1796644 RepID=UPI000751A150|nr:hypothetical protein [Rodentibacter heylii]AOF53677.1 hypothetical protein AC062_1585 [Pasteurellaceae bacterium NI1060]AOF54468.1 hypothetical protein AC062_2382 [Pasteurellaceae bacterium NI1060]OOF72137.1 hypothetical protein BKG91_11055 [Rodentibacter heylii]
METITISKSEYDELIRQSKRMKFIEHYRPTLAQDIDTGEYSVTVHENGIIDTLRYGKGIECIDKAIEDIQEMQKAFWIGEESEIFAGRTVEEILIELFDEKEREEVLREGWYGPVDLSLKMTVTDSETGIKKLTTISKLINEIVVFPELILTAYN